MRYPIRSLVLCCALLAGCDLLGELEGFLSRPTSAELAGTALILESETGCPDVHVRSMPAGGTEGQSLSQSDCLVAGSYSDFWLLKTSSASDVTLMLESDDFLPYVALFPVDLQSETALVNEGVVDRDEDGDGRATFTSRISAGLYVVVVNSLFEAETGDYRLEVSRGG